MNAKSLIRLWNHTQQHNGTSGARICASVLLGLYNGDRFPMDLTDLRSLDPPLREAALNVIEADASVTLREVHNWLNVLSARTDFGERFEWLASDYKCFKRGAITRKELEEDYPEGRPRALLIDLQTDAPPARTVLGSMACRLQDDDGL